MYLKSLKLVGFKSFADRTRLEFRPGVTVIVGPNGSGKSNLVDALSWVMGNQSTKALRTGKMEDVVFAGTATRPALNRAEATLVIDNAERQLGLDLDEVALTRRLYRDGSSDYEINGVSCRLLDIQELLSDSGVGRHQHVIIGQGEIGRQMRPLRRQARAAAKYDGLNSAVRDLSLYIARVTLEKYDAEILSASTEQDALSTSVVDDDVRVEELATSLISLTEAAKVVGVELDRDTAAAALL